MRLLILATILANLAIAQTPATKPWRPPGVPEGPASTQPLPALTTEEKAKIEAYAKVPTSQPQLKMVWTPWRKDGSRHPEYGQADSTFLHSHEEFLERSKQVEPATEVLFIGDSITQGWRFNGKKAWAENFAKYNAADFGISGDRTEHVLWRIANGELDAFAASPRAGRREGPKVVVVLIGVNNINRSAEDIAAGTTAVVEAVHGKLPAAKILLLSIFPLRAAADHPDRLKIAKANGILQKLNGGFEGKLTYLELWQAFLTEDGTLTKQMMADGLHPSAKGYEIWANTMNPVLERLMK